jgi:hypothetical protein
MKQKKLNSRKEFAPYEEQLLKTQPTHQIATERKQAAKTTTRKSLHQF